MQKYRQKILGTAIMSLFVLALSLVAYSYAQAQFIDLKKTFNVDGLVISIDANSLIMSSVATPAITMEINSQTVFTQNMTYLDFSPGDAINVIGKIVNDVAIAKVVKKNTNAGYGHSGDNVFVQSGEVIAISPTEITVLSNLTEITFQITASTQFVGLNFSDIEIGDKLQINGTESDTEFLADTIFACH